MEAVSQTPRGEVDDRTIKIDCDTGLLLGAALHILLLLLLRVLQGGEVNSIGQADLQADDDENHEQDGEEVRLVVECIDGLLRRTDLQEPVELSCRHCAICFWSVAEKGWLFGCSDWLCFL